MEKRILIVEDENIIALEIAWQIESFGYRVAGIISRGEEAIKLLPELKPDLILMDIRLKGKLDGFQTAEIIHSKIEIPVVYLSAIVDENIIQDLNKNSRNSLYLKKPFSEQELKSAIEISFGENDASKYIPNISASVV